MSENNILFVVLNGVAGDSRVIKTAKSAEEAGFKATIFGLGDFPQPTEVSIEGLRVVLFRNPALDLKLRGRWSATERPLHLMVEGALQAMTDYALRYEPVIVHSHDMLGIRVGAGLVRALHANGKSVRWVHDIHEYVAGLTTLPQNYIDTSIEYERRYIQQADRLLTVSSPLAAVVTTRYKLARDPEVVLNAPKYRSSADDSLQDVRSRLGLSDDAKLVVYVGAAKRERGCCTIVEAVLSLPDTHICFVSNNNQYIDSLRQAAEKRGAGTRFHALPYVASDLVTSFIRTADLGVHGLIHYPNGEVALPNKLFEYLHAGLPVALSDTAAMKEFIQAYKVGETFIAENAKSCAEAISKILNNPEVYRSKISKDFIQEFSWQTQSKKISNVYRELMQDSKGGRALLLSDGGWSQWNSANQTVYSNKHIGIVGGGRSFEAIDFYLDPSVDGERAGMLAWLADRYSVLHIVGNPIWPARSDLVLLADAGVAVHTQSADKAGTALLNFEQRAWKRDVVYLADRFSQWRDMPILKSAKLKANAKAFAKRAVSMPSLSARKGLAHHLLSKLVRVARRARLAIS